MSVAALAAELRRIRAALPIPLLRQALNDLDHAHSMLGNLTHGSQSTELHQATHQYAEARQQLVGIVQALGTVQQLIDRYLAHIGAGSGDGAAPIRQPSGDTVRSAIARADVGTQVWIDRVGKTIDPAITRVTTGIGFDATGRQVVGFASGEDDTSRAVQGELETSRQFPKPPGWRPGMTLAAAQHAETKHALWMSRNNVRHLIVVINHPRVCQPPFGCEVAVRTILPRGSSMTVVSSTSGLRWELKGVREP